MVQGSSKDEWPSITTVNEIKEPSIQPKIYSQHTYDLFQAVTVDCRHQESQALSTGFRQPYSLTCARSYTRGPIYILHLLVSISPTSPCYPQRKINPPTPTS